MTSPLALVSLALACLCGGFAVVYFVARRIDNYGIVDIAWSYAFGLLALLYALLGAGFPTRRLLIAILVVIWSARLGTHLAFRVLKHHPEEDTRYRRLRQDWAGHFATKMFWFFQMQAVSVVLVGAAFLITTLNPAPNLHPLEWSGALLWLIAVSGEALADAQLAAFKRDPAQRDGICNVGLWRYSRHPNYFFEWLVWVAYFVFALASPWGVVAIAGPAIMLYLLLRVTGIPMTEAQSIRRRGDAYRRYQQSTSAFVPWFPRQVKPSPPSHR